MPITMKNVLGIIGLAVIALFWVVITNVYGGLFVAVLIILVVVVLSAEQRRKRKPIDDKPAEPLVEERKHLGHTGRDTSRHRCNARD